MQVVGCLEASIDGAVVAELSVTYTPDVGVTDWLVVAPDAGADVSWALDPYLAQLAADHVVQVQAGDDAARVFWWAPEVEWGVSWSPKTLEYGAEPFEEEAAARRVSRESGRALVARTGPGPWVEVAS